WPHCLGVVMREQRRMLVASLAAALEPAGETRVQLCPLRLRQAAVGDLARERVLDRILTLARQRRAGAPADEVALGKQLEVGHAADELIDQTGPEHTPNYHHHLQHCLLCQQQQINTNNEHNLHRIQNLETQQQLYTGPGTVTTHEHATINQHRQQLLDEE